VLAGNSLGGTTSLRAAQNPSCRSPAWSRSPRRRFVDSGDPDRRPLSIHCVSTRRCRCRPGFVVRTMAEQLVPRFLYADAAKADAMQSAFPGPLPGLPATTTLLARPVKLVETRQRLPQRRDVQSSRARAAAQLSAELGPRAEVLASHRQGCGILTVVEIGRRGRVPRPADGPGRGASSWPGSPGESRNA